MKFCIGIMFQNEADWLDLHLPVLMESGVGLVGLDGGSTDGGVDVIRKHGGVYYENPYKWPPVHQHNKIIECCEDSGYDGMVKVDPDELFHPEHIAQMAELLEKHKVLRFPTFNFVDDRRHYCPATPWYPDWHARAWRLNIGIRYIHDFHSVPNWSQLGMQVRNDIRDDGERDVLNCGHIHLFHYGELKSRYARALRGANVRNAREGKPLIDALPEGTVLRAPFRIPFVGEQPLDPDLCGDRAPVEMAYHEI